MKKFIYLFFTTLVVFSCSDIINKEPLDEISPENLFQTESGYRNALDGIYGIMKKDFTGYNFCIYSIPEAINDDLVAGDATGFTFEGTNTDIYPLTYDATEFQTEGFWRISYEAINNVNTIIKNARVSNLDNKNIFLAEALGIRAMLHYNLYRLFAKAYNTNKSALAVPYRFETDQLLDIKKRSTNEEFIKFVIADLLEAEVIAENKVNSYKISKTAIQALLARVYHETNDFKNAIVYAKKALIDARYKLGTDAKSIEEQWQEDKSDEIIFRLRFVKSDGGYNAALLAIPVYSSYPYYVSNDLLNLYDKNNDIRFNSYFELHPSKPNTYYPKKHLSKRELTQFNQGISDLKLIRVPELYLILAESYDKTGDSGSALNNLNTLRNARGIGNYTGNNLSTEILNERRRELAYEGFRFTDLKRLGLGFTRSDNTSLAPKDNRFALPIPQLEIDRSGLKQNEGY